MHISIESGQIHLDPERMSNPIDLTYALHELFERIEFTSKLISSFGITISKLSSS